MDKRLQKVKLIVVDIHPYLSKALSVSVNSGERLSCLY